MNITRLTSTALAAAAIVVLVGCSSSSPTATAGVNRTDPRAVADAFATAWGAGDYVAACGLTAGQERSDLVSGGQCTGHAGWTPQPPRAIRSCTENGALEVIYQYDQEVDRFFIFTAGVAKQPDGTWAVETLVGNDVGETLYACRPVQPSGTA